MKFYGFAIVLLTVAIFLTCIVAQSQTNDQIKESNRSEIHNANKTGDEIVLTVRRSNDHEAKHYKSSVEHLYVILIEPVIRFFKSAKVTSVIRNIGVCAVNGFMELISYFLPAPMIPLIATAAGMVIPFEPIVMLKQKMPVTSYRRAFQTAVNGFIKTFDKYKVDADYDDDPYMTRRFNRRFMSMPNERDKPENCTHINNTNAETSNNIVDNVTATTVANIECAECNKTKTAQSLQKTSLFSIIHQFIVKPFLKFFETTKLCKVFKTIWACTIHAFTDMINEYLPVTNEEERLSRRFFRNLKRIDSSIFD